MKDSEFLHYPSSFNLFYLVITLPSSTVCSERKYLIQAIKLICILMALVVPLFDSLL